MFRLNSLRTLSLTAVASVSSASVVLTPSYTRQAFAEESSSPPPTCPVAFMWKWTGKLSLPFDHPPVDEMRVTYDDKHFPNGLNAIFLEDEASELSEKFGQGKGIFEDPEQREIAKALPEIIKMLKRYGLKYGSYVADIGAGTGMVTKELSKEVGDCGEVYAQELSPGFQTLIKEMVTTNKLDNTFVVGGTSKSADLPADAFDLAIVCDVYHHFEYPKTMCKSIRKALRKEGDGGGYLVVIDFHRDDSKIWSKPAGWVTSHVRAPQEVFRAEIESAGFKLVAEPIVEGLSENYVMVFQPV